MQPGLKIMPRTAKPSKKRWKRANHKSQQIEGEVGGLWGEGGGGKRAESWIAGGRRGCRQGSVGSEAKRKLINWSFFTVQKKGGRKQPKRSKRNVTLFMTSLDLDWGDIEACLRMEVYETRQSDFDTLEFDPSEGVDFDAVSVVLAHGRARDLDFSDSCDSPSRAKSWSDGDRNCDATSIGATLRDVIRPAFSPIHEVSNSSLCSENVPAQSSISRPREQTLLSQSSFTSSLGLRARGTPVSKSRRSSLAEQAARASKPLNLAWLRDRCDGDISLLAMVMTAFIDQGRVSCGTMQEALRMNHLEKLRFGAVRSIRSLTLQPLHACLSL